MNTELIGHIVREARHAQKITQQELAGICGVGVRFLRELECGKESIHMGKALTVMKALGLEMHITKRGER